MKRPPKPRSPLEQREQLQLANALDRLGVFWCHVPNGGARRRVDAAILKASGVRKGFPDNLIFRAPKYWPPAAHLDHGGIFHPGRPPLATFRPPDGRFPFGVAVELKRADGVPSDISPEQTECLRALALNGWYGFVARGCDEALDELRRLGFLS